MRPMTIRKRSPAPGLMKQIRPRKLTLTGRPANKEEFLLTKSQESTMDFAELVEKYELENEDELRKDLEESGISEDAVEGLIKTARVVSSVSDEVTGDELEKTFHALGYEFEGDDDTDDDVSKADEDEEPEITKSTLEDQGLDERTANAIVKMAEERDEQSDRIEKLEDRLEERDSNDALQKWVSKAEEFDALAGRADAIGKTLRAIEKEEGAEAAEDHLDMLRGADEAVSKSGLFEEVGVSGAGESSDAEDRLEKAIEQEMEKAADEGEDISRYEAKKRALRNVDEETRAELRGRE